MKKLLIFLALLVIALPSFSAVILFNGQKTDFSLVDIKDDNIVFVPLRDLEKAGLGVISSGENGAVEFSTKSLNFLFYKNSDTVKMNSLSLTLPKQTYMNEGKFMVPLSFIIKSLGGNIDQYTELIVTVDGLKIPKQEDKKAPALKNTPSDQPVTENKSQETKTEETETKETKTVTEHKNQTLNINWFQGTVIAYGKKLNLIDLDLYDAKTGKCIQTVQSNEGHFAFKGMPDGTYFIKADHIKNPSFRSYKTDNFTVNKMEGYKFTKPLNLIRAIKCDGINTIDINGQKCYSVTWTPVPNFKNYKVVLSCGNPKAKMPKYDKKTEKINIPISDLSKGQTYTVKIFAQDKYGNVIGESSDGNWSFSTM